MEFLNRLLRGKKPPKDKTETKANQGGAKTEQGFEEKILNTPLSRRQLLGGAAMTTGHLASRGVIPQAPLVVKEGVAEAAALLAPRLKNLKTIIGLVDMLNAPHTYTYENHSVSPSSEEYGKRIEVTTPTLEETFKTGIPLDSRGRWDRQRFFEMSWLTGLGLPEEVSLKALKDPDTIKEAFRLVSKDGNVDAEAVTEQVKKFSDAMSVLQKVTGISDDATIADLQKAYGNRIATIVRENLSNPAFMPLPTTVGADVHESLKLFQERNHALINVRDILRNIEKEELENQGLVNFFESEFEREDVVYRELRRISTKQREESEKKWDKIHEEERQKKVRGQRAAETRARKRAQERFNQDLEEREPIPAVVQRTIREARDASDAKVFLIKPQRYEGSGAFTGLKRMHIQHLRQALVSEKDHGKEQPILDNFDPANTQIEEIGNMVRVSTTDPKFQTYLESYADKSHKVLKVPNRLQMVVPRGGRR